LIREMLERGHDVVAVAPGDDEETVATLDSWGVPFRSVRLDRTGTNPLRDLAYLRQMHTIVRRERPGAVLAYTIKPIVHGMLAARLANVPVRAAMVEGSGYTFGSDTLRQRLVGSVARLLYRVGLASASVVFFLNPDDKAEFEARGMVARRKTLRIEGTGIDLDHYGFREAPEGDPVFLFIARLIREKGIEDFVEAARIVRRVAPRARFQVLGPYDPHPDAVSPAEVQGWEREGIIEYLGVVKDVRPVLAACSVFVLPSFYREGLPRTSLEALSVGRAVVTTDAPGCREAVEHGSNGYLVPPRDPRALSEALLRFVDDPAKIASMGHRSRELAERRFEVGSVNREILGAMRL